VSVVSSVTIVRASIIELVVDKIIQIDVSIKLEEIPDDEIESLFQDDLQNQEGSVGDHLNQSTTFCPPLIPIPPSLLF
jgi:hypothetical protein